MAQSLIKPFLAFPHFAVVGASNDPSKYGYRVLRWYISQSRSVVPVNPSQSTIQDIPCIASLSLLPFPKETALSIITPPSVTEKIIEEAISLGIPAVWMQPGSSSPTAVKRAQDTGMLVIADGPCILVDSNVA